MATQGAQNTTKQNEKENALKQGPQAKLWHITLAVIALVFYMGWMGFKFFGPPQPFENDKTRAMKAIADKAADQAGPDGDISKINPVDREAFMAMMRGAPVNPVMVLKRNWASRHRR